MTEQNDIRLTIILQDIRDSMQKLEQKLQWMVSLIAALLFTSGSNVALRVPEITETLTQNIGAANGRPLLDESDIGKMGTERKGTQGDL